MKVRIDALDTLTFGVGKPSVWGEDTFGFGMFPPFPSVVRGAARASYLYENGAFDDSGTDKDPTEEYAVAEYALLLNKSPHFPVPADFVLIDKKNLVQMELEKNDGLSSLTTPNQLRVNSDGKAEPAEKQYISREDLEAYLNGGTVTDYTSLSDHIIEESRIGIYRERDTKTVKDGMLYHVPLTRLENKNNSAAILANIDNFSVKSEPIRFGGENKVACFSEYSETISPKAPGSINGDGSFKLYLATPAIFDGGYLPDLPVKATLLTAAVNGYESAGGFDMKERRPKPMRRAVKAGSVYYYRLDENTEENRKAVLALHKTSICDENYRKDGFGICYIGKILGG